MSRVRPQLREDAMHMVAYLKRPMRGSNQGEYKKNDHAVLQWRN